MVVDIGLLHPATQARLTDLQPLRQHGDRSISPASQLDSSPTERRRVRRRHDPLHTSDAGSLDSVALEVTQHLQMLRDSPNRDTPDRDTPDSSTPPLFARNPRTRRRTGSPRQSKERMHRLSHHPRPAVKNKSASADI